MKYRNRIRISINHHAYTFRELSEKYDLPLRTVKSRYEHGKRGKEIIWNPRSRLAPGQKIFVAGKLYSLSELARKADISADTIARRYYHGLRGRKLIHLSSYAHHTPRHVTIGEHTYSFYEAGRRFGISPITLHSRYRNGDRGMELIRPVDHQLMLSIDGVHYTLRQLSYLSRLSQKTILRRYQAGHRDQYIIIASSDIPHDISIGGRTYNWLELAREFDVRLDTLIKRYHHGDRGIRLVRSTKHHRKERA